MPDLALEREALALFEAALDLPEPERESWADIQTIGRPELRARLAAMLAADRSHSLRTGRAADQVEEEAPPDRIGAYRIVELIGRGGMGSVYRGERATGDFAHRAAVKVIKPGLLSHALAERFRRERQLLAGLTHPNIAQLYDGGETEGGSPYFIMELVEGLPLLEWAERRQPSRAERQRLFRDICGAVAFAHGNLVVHRDLTPSNVLVTQSGTAKLIDFGIARPADEDGASRDAPSIGSLSLTPGYAAPERMTSAAVTTAADIFSLGKLLGRLIPPQAGDRELKAIIARATETEPAKRYPTADALGADVAAWAEGLPVSAMGGGRRYVAAKFIRRHRLAVSASVAVLLMLVTALALTLTAYDRAEKARRAEAARFAELRSLAHYMLFDLNGRLERVVGNTQARVTLANRAQYYLSALASSPNADDALKLEAARGLISLARAQGVPAQPNLGQVERARDNLRLAIVMLRAVDRPLADTAPDRVEALSAYAMVQAHGDADTAKADRSLAAAASILASVPPAERSRRWHEARRRLRFAQLEAATLGQRADDTLRLATMLEADVEQWPAAMRGGRAEAFDRAYATYYRGLHGYFTDSLERAVGLFQQSERQFVALDKALPNDPMLLYALMWNAYVGYGSASGLAARRAETEHFVDLAIRTSARLLAIESNDHSLRAFAGNLRQIQSQSLSAKGDHQAALAIQREVISLYEGALGPERRASLLNRLAMAQITMGNIARSARNRDLACSSYSAASGHLGELVRRQALLGTVKHYREGLEANVARCRARAPLSTMVDLA